MAALVLAGVGRAQEPPSEFERLFREGVTLGVEASKPVEFNAAIERLDEAAAKVADLPEDRRAPARFWVGVRKAEVYVRGSADERAKEVALEVRRLARAEPTLPDVQPVYSGYYRVLLLTLLRGTMTRDAFTELVESDGEAEFLFADETLATVRAKQRGRLYVPLQLMRCDLLESRGLGLQAFRHLRSVADEVREDPDTPRDWRRECQRRLVWHLVGQGAYDRAEAYLPDLDPFDRSYVRGLAAMQRGDADLAVREGLLLVELDDPNHKLAGHHLVGEGLEEQGDVDAARVQYEKALGYAQGADRRAVEINSIGDCYRLAKRLDEAEVEYGKALALLESGAGKAVEAARAENHTDLGLLAEDRGQPDVAYGWYARALDELERGRRDLPVDLLGTSWFRGYYVTRAIDGAIRTCEPAGHDLFDALAVTERGKARGMLDWMRAPPRPRALAKFQAAIQDLALVGDPSQLDASRMALERARELARQTGVRTARTMRADELREAVRVEPGTVFLSYWVAEDTAMLFVARGGTGELKRLELGTRDEALTHLREAYESVADPVADPWPALDAAAAFFVPEAVRPGLGDANLLVFCPDESTSRLPIEALRVGGKPLGTTLDIERAPSLSVRADLDGRDAGGDAVVVVDSVEARGVEDLAVEPLAFSAEEGDRTAAHYRDAGAGAVVVRRLRGDAASFAALESALREEPASLLHISSHGIAAPYVPAGSLLLLSDGPVSMASLADLSLRGTVVVLSACSTATGEARGSEGVAGLLWGPMAAGARSVVASLWMVNQEATAALMDEFHGARVAGLGDARALRYARTELASSSRYAHPHYWAGFAAYGSRPTNPRPGLAKPTELSVMPVLLGALAAMLVVAWWRTRQRRHY